MIRLLLVAFVGLTVAVNYETIYFEGGKEFVYKYETQIVNGVPESTRTFSIVKIRTNVRVTLRSRAQFIVKLENIEIARLNGRVEEVDPLNAQVPIEMMEPLPPADLAIMTSCLTNPFKIEYNRGVINEVFFDPTEPHYCVNIKKGVANMFQVNLDATKAMTRTDPTGTSRDFITKPTSSYTVMEAAPSGMCETLYAITEPENQMFSSSGWPLLEVTKVRNYKKCVARPVFFVNSYTAQKCKDCIPNTPDPITSTAHGRITLVGDRTRFFIKNAVMESKHIFAPNADINTYAVTIVNQTLNLIETTPTTSIIREPANLVPRMLVAEIPEIIPQFQGFVGKTPEPTSVWTKKIEIVKATLIALTKVITTDEAPIGTDSTCLINTIIEYCRNMTKTEIDQLISECATPTYTSTVAYPAQMKETLLRILPMVATPAAVEVVVAAIHTQAVPITVAVEMLTTCSLHVYNPDAIKKLLVLETCPFITSSPSFKAAYYLCLGACLHKMHTVYGIHEAKFREELKNINEWQDTIIPAQQTRIKFLVRSILRYTETVRDNMDSEVFAVIEKLLTSGSEADKIVAIKAIGNCASKRAITTLTPLIITPTTPTVIRVWAIYALEKTAKLYPIWAAELLLPIVLDQSLSERVRLTAYYVISHDMPIFVWEAIAHSLHNETNVHVGSYIYRHLKSISNSTYPCFASLAKNASIALASAKPFNDFSCRMYHFSYHHKATKSAYSADVNILGSPRSIIPRAALVKFRACKLGYNIDILEAGFSSEGLENIIEQFAGPGKLFKNAAQNSILQQLKEELRIKNRVSSPMNAVTMLKFVGVELPIFQLEPEMIWQWITTGMTVNKVIPLLGGNIQYITATECGLPLTADYKGTLMLRLSGQIQSNLPQLRPQIEVNVNMKPTITTAFVGKMEVDATVFRVGMSFRNIMFVDKVTIVSRINVDTRTWRISSSMELPQEEKIIMKYESIAATVFKIEPAFSSKTRSMSETRPIIVSDNIRIKAVKYMVPENILGANVQLVMQSPVCEGCGCPWLRFVPLTGRIQAFIKYTPTNPAQKIEFVSWILGNPSIITESSATYQYGRWSPQDPVSIESLINKLRPEIVAGADKYGVTAELVAVTGQVRKPVIQAEAICQMAMVRSHRYHCVVAVESMPWLPAETQNWKASISMDMEFPIENVAFTQLLTPEYQQKLSTMLKDIASYDALADEAAKILNSRSFAVWDRLIKNITYGQIGEIPSLNDPAFVIATSHGNMFAPPMQQMYIAITKVVAEQRTAVGLLMQLRLEAFTRTTSTNIATKQLIRRITRVLRIITSKLQLIRSRVHMLPSLQTKKIELIRITSNLQYAIKQQELILQKYHFSRIQALLPIYPYINTIQQECLVQKGILEELGTVLIKQQQRTWWTTNVLNEPVYVKNLQLEKILQTSSLVNIFREQLKCARMIHILMRTAQNTPVPPQQIIQKVKEVMQLFEIIEQKFVTIIKTIWPSGVENINENIGKAIATDDVLKLMCAVAFGPHQESILYDIITLVRMARAQPNPPLAEIYRIVEWKEKTLVKTLDWLAAANKVLTYHSRSLWKLKPAQISLPAYPNMFTMLLTVNFGKGTPSNVATAKIVATKSVEQIWWEIGQSREWTRDPRVNKILQLAAIRNDEHNALVNEIEMEMNTMRSFMVSVNYPTTIHPAIPNIVINYIKHLAFWKMTTVVPPPTDITPGVWNVWATIRTTGRSFDVLMVTPNEAMKIIEVPAPFVWSRGLPTYSFNIRAPAILGMCSIENNIVKTFDGRTFTIPARLSPMCEKAVMVDCSNRNALAITVRQEVHTVKTIAKVILNAHIIEVIPSTITPIVKIDAQIIPLTESVTITRTITYFGSQKQLIIVRHGDIVIIKVPAIGVILKTIGNRILIEPSWHFRTRVCGLCGNYDTHITNEFTDPSMYVHHRAESFSISYLRPSPQCPVSEYRELFQPITRTCVMSYKHDILTIGPRTCISLIPLHTCPATCSNARTTRMIVKYYCARSTLQSTKDLMALARVQRLHNLVRKQIHITKTIWIPRACTPNL